MPRNLAPSLRGRTPFTLGAVGGLLLTGVVLTGVVLAAPAAALEDPRRPVADVTHGPSCGPGVVRVQVVNGTQPHRVALVFDGTAEQDTALLAPGDRIELGSTDVGWGTTVAVTLAVAGLDGAAEMPLDLGTYTRPSKADCDALDVSAGAGPGGAVTSELPDARNSAPPAPKAAVPLPGADTRAPAPEAVPTDTQGLPPVAEAVDVVPASDTVPVASVAPGGVVTVRGSGFAPGEPVDVSLAGAPGVLATVAAAPDGTVEAVVQVPRGAQLGPVTVTLAGRTSSATSGLDLQVAARQPSLAESSPPGPVLAAGTALLVAGAAVGAAVTRRRRPGVARAPTPWP